MQIDEKIEKLVQKIVSLVSPDESTNNTNGEQLAENDEDSDGETMQILNDLNEIFTNLHKYSKYLDYDYIKALIHTLKAVVLDKETKLKNQNTIIDEGVAINDLYKIINVIQAIDVEDDYDILSEGAIIMGINGCGKSTLAKAICNLI